MSADRSLRAELASAQLRLRLGAMLRGLRAAVARRDARIRALARPEMADLAITSQHAHLLLAEAEQYATAGRASSTDSALTAAEQHRLADLDRRAQEAGIVLPAAALANRGLGALDRDLLALVAAPALHHAFGALYAYLNDLRTWTGFTAQIGVEVLVAGRDDEQQVLTACGPYGALRGDGWVSAAFTDSSATAVLRPADGVVEILSGADVDIGLLGADPVPAARSGATPSTLQRATAVAAAFRSGPVEVVGVWGPAAAGRAAVVATLAGRRRTVAVGDGADPVQVAAALQRAKVTDAVCVLEVPADSDSTGAIELVSRSQAPVILFGPQPVRVPELIRRRGFAEVVVSDAGFVDRRSSWSAAFPELDARGVDDLAGRFRLQPDEIEAVARFDASCAAWAVNGDRPAVDALAGLVSRRRSPRVASIRTPTRGRDSLVLPSAEMAQVLEVSGAARAWPRVADAWRLDRFGNPGVIALFTGEPGTGKTLAAEVIASEVGLSLMEVDLSRLVSKWLGETEKNLDAVFSEADASNCVLFFDEADSLFGQRGEVSRGSDRYANLEVGYLLQRLERFEGLAILASNLRGNLDPAFTRRFHHVVHFPQPAEPERRRLWEIALGPPVELAEPVDLNVLAGIELTGAGIAAIIRTAGLAAADAPSDTRPAGRPAPLTAAHIIAATRTQFQREARLLSPEELGAYDRLL